MKFKKALNICVKIGILFLSIFISFLLMLTGAYFKYSRDLPDIRNIPDPVQSSKIFSGDGQLMKEIYTQRRTIVETLQIPENLINALIAIEDKRFFSHRGIDPVAGFRAFLKNLKAGRIVQGASTITMQTARNIFLTKQRRFDRKFQEIILSLRIEQQYTKMEVLNIYLNNIYFGRGAYGIYEASKTYFDKELYELSLEECALIAALPKAPHTYNPFRNKDLAFHRRNDVLTRMLEIGFISEQEYSYSSKQPVIIARDKTETHGSYFIDFISRYLRDTMGEQRLHEGGYTVNTTIDLNMQTIAEESIRKGLIDYQMKRPFIKETVLYNDETAFIKNYPEYLKAKITDITRDRLDFLLIDENTNGFIDIKSSGFSNIKDFKSHFAIGETILISHCQEGDSYSLIPVPKAQAALIALSLENNSIKAMVGGFSYSSSQFNRAMQAKRQPGSAFKPFVFLTALIYGYGPMDIVYDLPVIAAEYRTRGHSRFEEGWTPSNFDGRYLGRISLSEALAKSRNTVSVRLAQEFSTRPVQQLAYASGISSFVPENLSMSLGTASISLLELCHSYTIFPNKGKLIPLSFIENIIDNRGNITEWEKPFTRDIVSPRHAYKMVRLLNRVITHGTGSHAASLNADIAGKTGTSNNFRDAWFIGFTPHLLVGVWVGMDDFSSLGRNFTGGATACPIFTDFMKRLDIPESSYFSADAGTVTIPVCRQEIFTCRLDKSTWFQTFDIENFFIDMLSYHDIDEDMFNFDILEGGH